MKVKNYINIALIIIWMFTIFNFSNQNGESSSGLSDKVIVTIAKIITQKDLTQEEKNTIIKKYKFIVRKAAHFTAYLILGLLFANLLIDLKGLNKVSIIISIIFCFIYACTDEFHQLFINGRNGSFIDVLIDTSGAVVGTLLIYFVKFVINRHITTK